MLTNSLIIVFILLMAFWWGVQGLFSGFLHLVATIAAGALAFSLWEPLAMKLMGTMPSSAWGVSLLVLFILWLLVLRVALDHGVPKNLFFNDMVDKTGGGICGALAGIVAAGMIVIGVGFLPLDRELGGYQPWAVGPDGQLQRNANLMVGVDTATAGLYHTLSAGAFYPLNDKPLDLYLPEVDVASAMFRMRYDDNSSVVAVPGSVEVTEAWSHTTPVPQLPKAVSGAMGNEVLQADLKLVVVDTKWTMAPGTYDEDRTLRIAPTHIRLIAHTALGSRRFSKVHAPVAVISADPVTKVRSFKSLKDPTYSPSSLMQEAVFGWVFLIKANETPEAMLVRRLRLSMPEQINQTPADVVASLGSPAAAALTVLDPGPEDGTIGGREGANAGFEGVKVEVSSALPQMVSRNMISGLRLEGDKIASGSGTVQHAQIISGNNRITHFYTSPQQALVRIKLDRTPAQSLLGAARATATQLAPPIVVDNRGQRWPAFAYVWLRGDKSQQIEIAEVGGIRSAKQLPVSSMQQGEELYLYFLVPRSVRIIKYELGHTHQDMSLEVPEK